MPARRERSKTQEILDFIEARGPAPLTPSEVAKACGISVRLASSLLNRLWKENALHRPSRGQYVPASMETEPSCGWDGAYLKLRVDLLAALGGARSGRLLADEPSKKDLPALKWLVHRSVELLGEKGGRALVSMSLGTVANRSTIDVLLRQ